MQRVSVHHGPIGVQPIALHWVTSPKKSAEYIYSFMTKFIGYPFLATYGIIFVFWQNSCFNHFFDTKIDG